MAHRPGLWSSKGPTELVIGSKAYHVGKISKADYELRLETQKARPIHLGFVGERSYWMFQDKFFWDNDNLTPRQVHALLKAQEQRKRQRIDRAEATVAMGSAPREAPVRRAIPDDLKQYVWARDEGRCRSCGATTELQFDHIIPVSMGGSNSEENLQILCGPCNRSKAAGLTVRR